MGWAEKMRLVAIGREDEGSTATAAMGVRQNIVGWEVGIMVLRLIRGVDGGDCELQK